MQIILRICNVLLCTSAVLGVISLTACTTKIIEPSPETSPQTNFYLWANNDWLSQAEIPSDKPGINNFLQINQKVNNDISDIISNLSTQKTLSSGEKKLITQFQAYQDQQKRNSLGLSPLQAELKQINAIQNLEDLSSVFAQLIKIGVSVPYTFTVMSDFKDSSNQILYTWQNGLGLKRDNYLGNDERSKKVRENYLALIEKLFVLSKTASAKDNAKAVLELESRLAEIQWSDTRNRDLKNIYNDRTYEQYKTLLSNLNIDQQIKELNIIKPTSIIVAQTDYIENLNTLFTEVDLKTWKSYLTLHLILEYATLLSEDFDSAITDYEIARGLYDEPLPLKEKAVQHLNKSLGQLVGKVFVEKRFDENMKSDVTSIIKNITDEYRVAITESTKLTAPTKAKALDKLNKMKFKIGYPNEWQDYSSLTLEKGQLVQNVKRINEYELKRIFNNYNKPQNPNEWGFPPQTVNAFYQPTNNSFTILAGILYPPFYSKDASLAQKYGSIGFIIGHEIGHGFDDSGSQFDGDGNLKNWWADEDRERYNMTKNALIAQADNYEIMPDIYLRGALEIGEILGDKNGSEIAFRTFKKLIAKEPDVNKKQAYQEFFKNLATTWRSKLRKEYQLVILESDAHPPSEFRTNGIVVHFDEFFDVFNVKEGDPMFRKPEDRVSIW